MNGRPHEAINVERIVAGRHTYVFTVKENRRGKRLLCVTQQSSYGSAKHRKRVTVPEYHLQAFHEAYYRSTRHFDPIPKAYRFEELRERYPNAFRKWTGEDDKVLATMFNAGVGVGELSTALQRQTGAILFRLLHLGLIPA
jgi:hypothetical protein